MKLHDYILQVGAGLFVIAVVVACLLFFYAVALNGLADWWHKRQDNKYSKTTYYRGVKEYRK